ncbi:MAG: hypothetical protein P8Y00_12850, partial [Deltaproteobacteria bacterium]
LFVTYLWGKPQPARRVECGGGKDPPEIRHRKDQPEALEWKKGFLPGSVEPILALHQRWRISAKLLSDPERLINP